MMYENDVKNEKRDRISLQHESSLYTLPTVSNYYIPTTRTKILLNHGVENYEFEYPSTKICSKITRGL